MQKIMFNDLYGLTAAVLRRKKTQTRRITAHPVTSSDLTVRTKYRIGEVVAVAQRYKDVAQGGYPGDSRYDVFQQPNWGEDEEVMLKSSPGWTNKMFVKADLMPHNIQITDIRVERLQDISDEDCIKEGIRYLDSPFNCYYFEGDNFDTPREAYAALIDKVCAKGTWESNPWVVVYDFKLIK